MVLSADTGVLEGVVLQGDVAYFDNDLSPDARSRTGGDAGVARVIRREIAF